MNSPMMGAAVAVSRFDSKLVTAFCDRSRSESTRRNYRQVIEEFFNYTGGVHPALLTSNEILHWRDNLVEAGKRPATVTLKLAVIRSFYEYLKNGGVVSINPAATDMVRPPKLPKNHHRRLFSEKEIHNLMAGPDRQSAEGARDYALLQIMWRLSLALSEISSLRVSSLFRTGPSWVMMVAAKNGRDRVVLVPDDIKAAIDSYLLLDEERRRRPGIRSNGPDAFLFQPVCNYRTLEFNRPLTTRMIRYIVKRWAEYAGLEHTSPRDARRRFVVNALEQGLSYADIKAIGGWRSSKTLTKYKSEKSLEQTLG